MIRAQRRSHLMVWLVLPIALLLLIAWSLSVRPSWAAPGDEGGTPRESTP